MRRALRVLGLTVAGAFIAFSLLVASFSIEGSLSAKDQLSRMEELRSATTTTPLVETPLDDELPYNQLQVVATHNSYNLAPTWLQTRVIAMVEPSEAPALQYSHQTLTEQLEAGIRSVEIDVRWNGTDFDVSHVPLVGNRATTTDFGLGLEEIKLWSDAHPGHLPISIMVEVKFDYMFLDPSLRAFDADAADSIDELVAARLGDTLFAPDDLGGGEWPTVGELRDRVLLYFGDNETVHELYLDGHPRLEGRSIFTSSRTGSDDARFVILDDPTDPLIPTALANGVIVRTRADAELVTSATRYLAALESGVQIVATDYPPSEPQEGTDYMVSFPGGKLARTVPAG